MIMMWNRLKRFFLTFSNSIVSQVTELLNDMANSEFSMDNIITGTDVDCSVGLLFRSNDWNIQRQKNLQAKTWKSLNIYH